MTTSGSRYAAPLWQPPPRRAGPVQREAENALVDGIDEHTALVGRIGGEWEVMGAGGVSVLTRDEVVVYRAGSRMTLPD